MMGCRSYKAVKKMLIVFVLTILAWFCGEVIAQCQWGCINVNSFRSDMTYDLGCCGRAWKPREPIGALSE
ncbi:hypothetical protein HRbin17_00026 [bacterium HR17]|uniref:Uncharacterized protein n=1 Tax=Candidatus Fervidibacter japonicus TaxID=2035412 RepID=A0A2H5X8M7_9BACT|nr:hypothetical protein HRbin17_00026 [bacterium HR17]